MFGDFLRERRVSQGMTLQQVGTALGVGNRQNFWNSEMGKNYANKKTLRKVAEVLNVDYNELIIRKYLDRIGREVTTVSKEKLESALQLLLSP